MSEPIFINDYIPIPEIFHQEKEKTPFQCCSICGKELYESGERYLIEKAYHQDLEKNTRKLIFEIAYCLDCMETFREELSEESLQNIEKYYKENAKFEERQEELSKYKLFETDIWLNNCVIKNKSIDELEEFQIYSLCQGSDMLFYNFPYMISSDAVDDMLGLLSNKSLDIINDFTADFIDLPPELRELFPKNRPILI